MLRYYDRVVALKGRHCFAGANEPLGRVSRTAESSLKEASLAEASEFKVPSKGENGESSVSNDQRSMRSCHLVGSIFNAMRAVTRMLSGDVLQ